MLLGKVKFFEFFGPALIPNCDRPDSIVEFFQIFESLNQWHFALGESGSGISGRIEARFDGTTLCRLARPWKGLNQISQLMASTEIYRSGSAARKGDVGLQILTAWFGSTPATLPTCLAAIRRGSGRYWKMPRVGHLQRW